MSVFVTTGATETFQFLVRLSVSEQFLDYVSTRFDSVAIQFGKDVAFTQQCLAENRFLTKSKQNQTHVPENASPGVVRLSYVYNKQRPVWVELFSFTSDIQQQIQRSELVVSHAGTGSILDALRQNKRLFVVVNDKLQDNHQLEISNAFKDMNLLEFYRVSEDLSESGNIEAIVAQLEAMEHHDFAALHVPNKNVLNDLVRELL